MKKLLFLLLFPLHLFAQSGEPVSDTSWLEKQGNLFFEVKKQEYADASEVMYKTLIGDTATLVQAARYRITSRAATMAVDVRHVSTYRRSFTDLLREATAVQTLTGIDPQRLVQEEYDDGFLLSGWTIRRDGVSSPVEFSLNAQGGLRYNVNGGSNSAANLIGMAIRLRNYPSNGTFTDLFLLPTGVWVNPDRTIVLRPAGNDTPVNRAAAPAPTKTKKG